MKTALTEFIEYLEGIQERDNIPTWVITTGKNYLQGEKQQIMEARDNGYDNAREVSVGYDSQIVESETYYKETYGK